jgi:hypothetical protein
VQTSYNGTIRKNFAGIGMNFDRRRDAFIAPACHDVAVLDETTCQWIVPEIIVNEAAPE